METVNLLNKITIYSSSNLSSDDLDVLTLLYLPLIKSESYSLYLTLYTLMNRSNLHSETFLLKDLVDLINITPKKFYEARNKLEAIGLLSTYVEYEEYALFLKNPLTARQFVTDGVLGSYLCAEIGESHFKRIIKKFQIPKVDKTAMKEVTKSFDEVFKSSENISKVDVDSYLIDKKPNKSITINNYHFNYELFLSGLDDSVIEKRNMKKFESYICNIAYAYQFKEDDMQKIYLESISSSGKFDYITCTKKAKAHYEFLYHKMPKLATVEDVDFNDFEKSMEELTAVEILKSFSKANNAIAKDVKAISDLYEEFGMCSRSIINLAVLKALKQLNGQVPAPLYYRKILSGWIDQGIKTFQEAFNLIGSDEKENTEKEISPKTKSKKPINKKDDPEWLKNWMSTINEKVEKL